MQIRKYEPIESIHKWWMPFVPIAAFKIWHRKAIKDAVEETHVYSRSVTTQPIEKRDFTVERDGVSVPVRMYRKKDLIASQNQEIKQPAMLYAHGGGFYGGSLEEVEHFVEAVCEKCNITVFSVDYDLAPAKKYPHQCNQVLAVYREMLERAKEWSIDEELITFGGDSAGGHIAATSAIMAQEEGIAINKLMLLYPVLDMQNMHYKSYRRNSMDYKGMKWVVQCIRDYYLSNRELCGRAPIYLLDLEAIQKLPPVFLAIAGVDGLRDAQLEFNQKLIALKKEHETVFFEETPHGFVSQIGKIPQGEDLISLLEAFL